MYNNQLSPSERKLKLCALPACKGKRYDLVHKFPMNNERAQQWIDAIDLPEFKNTPIDKIRSRYFICSKHFRPQDYKNCESRSLNTTAYPRLLLDLTGEDDRNFISADEMTFDNVADIRMNDESNGQNTSIDTDEAKVQTITIPTLSESNVKSEVQFVVYQPLNKTPSILKKKANILEDVVIQQPVPIQTIQKTLNIYSPAIQTNNTISRLINTVKADTNNATTLKRNTNYIIEPIRKKIIVNDVDVTKTYGNTAQNNHKGFTDYYQYSFQLIKSIDILVIF